MPYFSYTQIHFGPVTLYTWGLFVGLAFLIGYWLVLREAKKEGINQRKIFWLAIFIFLGSILGARLGYLLQFSFRFLEFFQFKVGGLMFYGGFFGALLAGWLYLKYCYYKDKTNCFFCLGTSSQSDDRVPSTKKQFVLSFLRLADILTPSIALGIFIGRIGCFLIKDHPGAITNLPWAIQWPDGIFRHPVALYLSLNGLIMFLVLWLLRTRLKKTGQLFIIFLLWYSAARFFLDFTRVNDPQYSGLFISQWISLFVLVGLFFFIFSNKSRHI
jgi:phosphatidylglycerol:prolipoprotein diacylglycerol transferase